MIYADAYKRVGSQSESVWEFSQTQLAVAGDSGPLQIPVEYSLAKKQKCKVGTWK